MSFSVREMFPDTEQVRAKIDRRPWDVFTAFGVGVHAESETTLLL